MYTELMKIKKLCYFNLLYFLINCVTLIKFKKLVQTIQRILAQTSRREEHILWILDCPVN